MLRRTASILVQRKFYAVLSTSSFSKESIYHKLGQVKWLSYPKSDFINDGGLRRIFYEEYLPFIMMTSLRQKYKAGGCSQHQDDILSFRNSYQISIEDLMHWIKGTHSSRRWRIFKCIDTDPIFIMENVDGKSTYLLKYGVKTLDIWQPPEIGWNTYSVDAAFPVVKRKYWVPAWSCIEFNETGKLVFWWRDVLKDVISSEHAEASACFEAIKIAKHRGVKKLELKTDCENVANKIWGVDKVYSHHERTTYSGIWDMMQCFDDFKIKVVYREQNSLADFLATSLTYNRELNEKNFDEAVTGALDQPYRLRQEKTSLPSS